MKSKDVGKNRKTDSDFAALLEQSLQSQAKVSPGYYSYATIKDTTASHDFVFITTNIGTGIVKREEFLDQSGSLTVNPGEKVHAFFLRQEGGENHFTTAPGGKIAQEILNTAMEKQIPLSGTVLRKIKGGYEVRIGDVIAFCPGSHMEGEPDPGANLMFVISETDGKRTIVSHKIYREMLREVEKDRLRESLGEGDVVEGTIKSLHDFGAFVDLGGMEALIPISEMSFQRIAHPSEVFKTGQQIRARVMQVDWKEDRITLSYRALLKNPWQGSFSFSENDIVTGTVESIKNFGIFVKLNDQFTGLVPISESGIPRGQAPDRSFQTGKEIRVMILKIDRENQRITLSVAKVKDADTRKDYEEYMKKSDESTSGSEGISSFGKALLASLEKKEGNKKSDREPRKKTQ